MWRAGREVTLSPTEFNLHELEVPTAGPRAPQAMAAAIARLDRRTLDCLVVIRGGDQQST